MAYSVHDMAMKTILTLSEVLARARKLGVKCSESAFWKYYKLGLVPKGKKYRGYGNVLWFPPGTEFSLWWIYFWTKEIGLSLNRTTEVAKGLAESFPISKAFSPFSPPDAKAMRQLTHELRRYAWLQVDLAYITVALSVYEQWNHQLRIRAYDERTKQIRKGTWKSSDEREFRAWEKRRKAALAASHEARKARYE